MGTATAKTSGTAGAKKAEQQELKGGTAKAKRRNCKSKTTELHSLLLLVRLLPLQFRLLAVAVPSFGCCSSAFLLLQFRLSCLCSSAFSPLPFPRYATAV
jgi:hypothetical protein